MAGKTKTSAANHLRAWRRHRTMTQGQLAEKAGTTASIISELESGHTNLSDKWLRRLAPILGTTPGFLLDYAPESLDSKYLQAALEVPEEARIHVAEIMRTFRHNN